MRYLLDFINTAPQSEIDNYLSINLCTVIKQWNNFDKVYLVETDNVPPNSPLLERIEEENTLALKPHDFSLDVNNYHNCHSDPSLPDLVISTTEEKDWWKNFTYNQPNFEDPSLTIKRGGQNITVYIMDSGIDITHPEFEGANITNLYSVINGDFTDRAGHGTALASLIVGKTCGITEANVKVVKIFDTNHATLQSEFLSALDAIIEDHPDGNFGVINCSWSIPKNEWVENKLRIAEDEGLYVVAAAGNSGVPIEDVTPASMMEVITVGAYNQNLEPCDFSDYTGPISTGTGTTNHGELDGWAPGENIYVAQPGGTYTFVSGTSVATAITSAVIASNLTWNISSDGVRHLPYANLRLCTVSEQENFNHGMNPPLAFLRDDLLDLSDPKYANSVNRIATLYDACLREHPQLQDEFSFIFRVNTNHQQQFFSQTVTKNITCLTPLPENFFITNRGMLWGKPTPDQGPQNGEHYNLITLQFVRTDLNDEQENVTVNLYIMEENKDINEIPPDDPVIPITLLVNCLSFVCRSGSTSSCFPQCGVSCCASQKSLSFQCRCSPA